MKVMIGKVEDQNRSVLIFKCHHALTDGMSLIALTAAVQDVYDKSKLFEFAPKLSICKQFIIFLTLPFTIVWNLGIILFALSANKNALTLREENDTVPDYTGEKVSHTCEDWSLQEMKDAAKTYKAGLNDFILALISVAMHKYYMKNSAKKGKKVPDYIRIGLPASFRRLPDTAEDLDLCNDLSPLYLMLTMTSDFKLALTDL